MGYLDVADPEKVYARRVRTMADYGWSWRIHVPQKPHFQLRTSTSGIPAEGFPTSKGWTINHPGENLVDASVEQSQNGTWYLRVKVVHDFSKQVETVPFDYSCSESGSVFQPLAISDPGSRLVLLRLRKSKLIQGGPRGSLMATSDPQPCDGLMIWIEPTK
jgi:hypothetical protein